MNNKGLRAFLLFFPDDAEIAIDSDDGYMLIYYGEYEVVKFSQLDMIYKYNKESNEFEEIGMYDIVKSLLDSIV